MFKDPRILRYRLPIQKEYLHRYDSITKIKDLPKLPTFELTFRYIKDLLIYYSYLFLLKEGYIYNEVNKITEYSYKEVNIDLTDLVNQICEYSDTLEYIYHNKPKYLIVGPDLYKDIRNIDFWFRFTIPDNFTSPTSNPYLFAGLQVIVVPWVKGLLILPDLDTK